MSTLFAILSSLIRVFTLYNSQQSDQGLHYLPFSAVWSESPFSLVWSRFTLFAILSSLIKVYIVSQSQQSDQGLHCLPFSAAWSVSTLFAILSKQYSQVLHCLPFSVVWSGSKPPVILSSLTRFYNIWKSKSDQGQYNLPFSRVWSGLQYLQFSSKQYYQGLLCLLFSAVRSESTLFVILSVWSRSTFFAILSSLIRVYIICHSERSYQGLNFLPF